MVEAKWAERHNPRRSEFSVSISNESDHVEAIADSIAKLAAMGLNVVERELSDIHAVLRGMVVDDRVEPTACADKRHLELSVEQSADGTFRFRSEIIIAAIQPDCNQKILQECEQIYYNSICANVKDFLENPDCFSHLCHLCVSNRAGFPITFCERLHY